MQFACLGAKISHISEISLPLPLSSFQLGGRKANGANADRRGEEARPISPGCLPWSYAKFVVEHRVSSAIARTRSIGGARLIEGRRCWSSGCSMRCGSIQLFPSRREHYPNDGTRWHLPGDPPFVCSHHQGQKHLVCHFRASLLLTTAEPRTE